MGLTLYTSRLGYRAGKPWLDVSLQGNLRRAEKGEVGGQDGVGLLLAPSPDLLYPYLSAKRWGRLGPGAFDRYAEAYTAEMRARYKDPRTRPIFHQLLQTPQGTDRELVLLCFCVDSTECHRTVLADLLVRAGHNLGYDVTYAGEEPWPAKVSPAAALAINGSGVEVVPGGGKCSTLIIHGEGGIVGTGHVCGGGRRKRCKGRVSCNAWSTKLCDYPLTGKKKGKTCDVPICDGCAESLGPEIDYCPAHARVAREAAAGGEAAT